MRRFAVYQEARLTLANLIYSALPVLIDNGQFKIETPLKFTFMSPKNLTTVEQDSGHTELFFPFGRF